MAVARPNVLIGTAPKGPDENRILRRISFVDEAPTGSLVRREFTQPRRMVAIEVESDEASTDQLQVVFVPPGSENIMVKSDHGEGGASISIELKGGATIEWRPGRAIVRNPAEDADEILTAIIDFAFYERELRTLEEIVEAQEPQALEDVSRAHRVSRRDRSHWSRIGETIELLTRARLTFARLEPLMATPSKTLAPVVRRVLRQLSARADTSARLASLTGRLEALEDLYEGANDRIADFRGWNDGQILEVGIVVLLVLEIVLMAGDMYLHYLELQAVYRGN